MAVPKKKRSNRRNKFKKTTKYQVNLFNNLIKCLNCNSWRKGSNKICPFCLYLT